LIPKERKRRETADTSEARRRIVDTPQSRGEGDDRRPQENANFPMAPLAKKFFAR